MSGDGGVPETLTTPDTDQGEQGHLWPFIIDGREAVVFVISGGAAATDDQLAVLDLETAEVTRLGLVGVSPHYGRSHMVNATTPLVSQMVSSSQEFVEAGH